MGSPEGKQFIELLVEHLLDTCSTEDLQLLLTEEEDWKALVAEADLSREEEDALREALSEVIPDAYVDDEDRLQDDLQARERFLNDYPRVKLELIERIKKLHALADKVDKVHRDCTISNVVASSTGAVSGVLTILGFALAPVTAGVSLMLSATGIGLGTAAAVTSVSTSIVDQTTMSLAEAEAKCLVSTSKNTVKEAVGTRLQEAAKSVILGTPKVASQTRNCIQGLRGIVKNIRAMKLIGAKPRLVANAKRLMTTGRISARNTKQVQKAFGGTALAMTRGARIMGAATAGVFLLMDVVSLVEESKHLQEGAKAESAAELRRQASDLEQELQMLNEIYDHLKKTLTQ